METPFITRVCCLMKMFFTFLEPSMVKFHRNMILKDVFIEENSRGTNIPYILFGKLHG